MMMQWYLFYHTPWGISSYFDYDIYDHLNHVFHYWYYYHINLYTIPFIFYDVVFIMYYTSVNWSKSLDITQKYGFSLLVWLIEQFFSWHLCPFWFYLFSISSILSMWIQLIVMVFNLTLWGKSSMFWGLRLILLFTKLLRLTFLLFSFVNLMYL